VTRLLPLLCLSTIACVVPAWKPGDPPLTFTVDSDRTGELVLMGCALWADAGIGLECRLVAQGGAVDAYRAELGDHGAYSTTEPCGFLWTDRSYSMRIDPFTYALMDADVLDPANAERALDRAAAIAAHEIGHLMGIWGHLDGPALMDESGSTDRVTPADVRALPWAEELR
jgi:hypothetical protein